MEDVSLALLSLPSSPLQSATENDFPSMSQSIHPPRSQEPEHTLKPGYVCLQFLHYGAVRYVKVYTLKCEGCNKSARWGGGSFDVLSRQAVFGYLYWVFYEGCVQLLIRVI